MNTPGFSFPTRPWANQYIPGPGGWPLTERKNSSSAETERMDEKNRGLRITPAPLTYYPAHYNFEINPGPTPAARLPTPAPSPAPPARLQAWSRALPAGRALRFRKRIIPAGKLQQTFGYLSLPDRPRFRRRIGPVLHHRHPAPCSASPESRYGRIRHRVQRG